MKFFCDRCQTKYSIADEKVRRKVLKVRCKTCSNIIEVREPAASGPMPAFKAAAEARKPASPLTEAFDNAFEDGDGAATQIANTAGLENAAQQAPMVLEDEWYFALDGNQEGPLGFRALVDKVVKTAPGADVLVWRDGFDDWVPPTSVPELKPHLKRLQAAAQAPMPIPPPPPAPAPPARLPTQRGNLGGGAAALAAAPAPARAAQPARMQAQQAMQMAEPAEAPLPAFTVEAAARAMSKPVTPAAGTPVGGSPRKDAPPPPSEAEAFIAGLGGGKADERGENGHAKKMEDLIPHDSADEFVIGEASRIVRLPQLAALPALGARPQRAAGRMSGANAALPGMGGTPAPLLAPSLTPGEAVAVDIPIAGVSAESGPVSDQAAFAQAAAMAAATHKRRMRSVLIAAIVGGVVILGVLMAVLWPSGSEESGYSSGSDHLAGVEFDENGRIIVRGKPQGGGGISISGTGLPQPTRRPVTSGGPRPSTQSTAPSPSGQVGLPPLPSDDGERTLNFGNKTGGNQGGASAPEAAYAQIKQSQAGVKICYERLLKQDPTLKSLRKVNLNVKISAGGGVKDVGVGGGVDPTLVGCIQNLARGWKFPKNTTDYSVEAQIILN